MNRRKLRSELGLTLVEITFVMALVVLLAYLSLSALKPARERTSTHGLVAAVIDEFKAARELAIRSGQPVAVGLPTNGGSNPMACSIYRIKGWNTPYVTWSVGYSGDYRGYGFAAATWAGAPPAGAVNLAPSAKFFSFDNAALMEWLPDDTEQDYIFCYLPDGSLITNSMPASDGRYTVVVAGEPNFTGAVPGGVQITAGNNPITIYLSPAGGVESRPGCPGGTIAPGAGTAQVSDPKGRTKPPPTNSQRIILSDLIVRPNPTGLPGEGVCVPGQYVTLEILAYSPEGVPLFANWVHTEGTITPEKGAFTYPDGQGALLQGEADRMEYLPYDKLTAVQRQSVFWGGFAPAVGQGVFRAQWSWTVPLSSQEGDEYQVTVNVQNASADATIVNGPPPVKLNPAPPGRMVVERRDPLTGLWQLWRMNPDGTGEQLLSPKGVSEILPTLDRAGTQLAFLQGPAGARYVKVRALEGGLEHTVAGPGNFTSVSLSPDGSWVSYRDDTGGPTNGTLITTRIDGSTSFTKPQGWYGGGYAVKKSRSGWSWDGKYMLYGTENTIAVPRVYAVDLSNPGPPGDPGSEFIGPIIGPIAHERLFCPTVYNDGGQERVLVSCSGQDAFLLDLPVTDYTSGTIATGEYAFSGMPLYPFRPEIGGPGSPGSTDLDDDYPSVSLDGQSLFVTRSPKTFGVEDTEDQTVLLIPRVGGRFLGPPQAVVAGDVRRAIFIPDS